MRHQGRLVQFTVRAFVAMAIGLLATAAYAKNPYLKPDNTWISISGTVESVAPDSFRLDYGDGEIIVEMDDGDRDADGYKLLKGDKVIVNGRIDNDFFEKTTIEASSVYVEKLGTTFYASAIDEEDIFYTLITPVVVSDVVVQGVVTEIDGDEFTLDTAARSLTVDTEKLGYNPLDDEGYQKIGVGDLVRVRGRIDYSLFEGHEIKADSVIKVVDRSRKK